MEIYRADARRAYGAVGSSHRNRFSPSAQLYNMRGQQGETDNVAERHPKTVKYLQELLNKELEAPQHQ